MSSKFMSAPGGSRGTTGPQGPTGAPGANGLSLDVFLYKFSAATTGTPAAGFIRLDSAPATATRLVIATVDGSGRDQTVPLQLALGASGSKIRIQLRTNIGSYIEVTSTGAPSVAAFVGAIEWPVASAVVGPVGAPLDTNEVYLASSSDVSALAASVAALQASQTAQDGLIAGNTTTISNLATSQLAIDAAQNTAISALQTQTAAQGTRIDINEASINTLTQNVQVTQQNQDASIGVLQTQNVAQDFALQALNTSQSAQDTSIGVLQAKTVALTTDGRFGTAPEPQTSNAVDLGSSTYRWRDVYTLGTIRCNGTGLAVDRIFNGSEQSGINLLPGGPDCKIQLSGTDYTGNADRAVTLATNGTLQKSGATISQGGNILGQSITATGDMSCVNLSATLALRSNDWFNLTNDAGIALAPTAGGTLTLRGTDYVAKAGQFLTLDAGGTLVAAPVPPSFDVKNDVPINQSQAGVYLDKAFNLYGATDKGFPQLPTPTNYLGAVYPVSDEATFDAAYASAVNGDVLSVSGSITFTSEKTIAKSVIIVAFAPGASITLSTANVIFTVTAGGVRFQGLTLNNPNTGSNAGLISFTGTANTGCEVSSCRLETNEAAIYTAHASIVIRDNTFVFVGTPDSHRYIFVTACLGNCFILRNTFHGNGTNNTQCVIITNSVAANYLNGALIISENTTATAACQRLLMIEIPMTGSNFRLLVSKNTITASDFIIHFSPDALDGFKAIWLVDNTHILNPTVTSSKGLVGLDTATTGTISLSAVIYASGNTIPVRRTDYSDLVAPAAAQPNLVTYSTTKFTPAGLFDVIIPLITSLAPVTGGTGDVVGPATATDNAVARFDTATGKLLQSSLVTVDDSGILNGATGINVSTGALVQGSVATFEGATFRGNAFLTPAAEVSLVNAANVGVAVRAGADARIRLTGSEYSGAAKQGQYLRIDDTTGTLVAAPVTGGGTGDVVGPAGATDEAIARFDTATGKLLQSSSVSITDSGIMNGVTGINLATSALVQGPATTFEGSVFRGNAFLNPGAEVSLVNVANIGVAVKQDGGVRCTAAAYAGNSDRAVTFAADGTIQKTATIITPSGTISGEHINASGDVSCVNLSAGALRANTWINSTNNSSIDLAPTAGGAVGFRGTEYANSAGKLLSIADTAGRLAPLNLVGPGTLRVDANGLISVLLDPVAPAIVTPHNLTSATSDPDFTVSQSSVFANDVGNYGGWRCFDEAGGNPGYWASGQNNFSNGVQTTGVIAPMPTPGTWIAAVFTSDKTISKLRYKGTTYGMPADFSVARWNGTNWVDSGFSVVNAAQVSHVYVEHVIPTANGGGGLWRGIALVISRIHQDLYSAASIEELDFQ